MNVTICPQHSPVNRIFDGRCLETAKSSTSLPFYSLFPSPYSLPGSPRTGLRPWGGCSLSLNQFHTPQIVQMHNALDLPVCSHNHQRSNLPLL